MKEQMRIVKGFEVNSRPIGEKGTRCRYTTTKEIALQPLSLEHARLSSDPDGRSVISLRFNCSHLADWRRVDLSQIRSTLTPMHRWPAPCMKPLP